MTKSSTIRKLEFYSSYSYYDNRLYSKSRGIACGHADITHNEDLSRVHWTNCHKEWLFGVISVFKNRDNPILLYFLPRRNSKRMYYCFSSYNNVRHRIETEHNYAFSELSTSQPLWWLFTQRMIFPVDEYEVV